MHWHCNDERAIVWHIKINFADNLEYSRQNCNFPDTLEVFQAITIKYSLDWNNLAGPPGKARPGQRASLIHIQRWRSGNYFARPCTLHSALCTLHSVLCALCTLHYAFFTLHCVHCALCALHCALCALWEIKIGGNQFPFGSITVFYFSLSIVNEFSFIPCNKEGRNMERLWKKIIWRLAEHQHF